MPIDISSVRISLEGFNGSTKTATALTAPYPSVLFAFDPGWEGAIFGVKYNEFFKGLDIHPVKYVPGAKVEPVWQEHDITIFELPPVLNQQGEREQGKRELWQYFSARIAAMLVDPAVKTGIVDTGTRARRIRVDAHLQMLQENAIRNNSPMRSSLIQIEYGIPNDAIRDIYTNFAAVNKNLIMTHHLLEERKDMPVTNSNGSVRIQEGVPTGEYLLEGYTKTYDEVDLAMRIRSEVTQSLGKPAGTMEAHSYAKFQKCRYNLALKGTELKDMTWNSLMGWIELSLADNIRFPKSQIAAGVV